MLSYLIDIDIQLFLFLNGIHSPIWDVIFAFITHRYSWIPLYILLVIITATKLKGKSLFVVFSVLTIVLVSASQSSVELFKNVFERLRPCHNPELSNLVHIVNGHCGGKFGFVSSHASNSFALAIFIGLILKPYYRYIFPLLFFWAALVAYSRIYVGVHYPADILVGSILGAVIALLGYYLVKYLNKKFHLKINQC